MATQVKTRKKLIEVALPLEAINAASAREKSIRHGHPSTLHLWWARRPLATARSVIFAQMVDDPSEYTEQLLKDTEKTNQARLELAKRLAAWKERKAKHDEARSRDENLVAAPGPVPTLNECVADIERERLFGIIRQLVKWENTTNEMVLTQAREEIWKSWRRACEDNKDHPRAKELFNPEKLPAFHDPFAGGGALPLEAQRLGLEAYASDLNPVAVLINKAMIEIPPKFAGRPPVNPESRKDKRLLEKQCHGAQGLAEDVRYYGKWMRDEAEKRIGHLYPKVEITEEIVKSRPDLKSLAGQRLTVIAWIWARTVKSPNPAFAHISVPLVSTFMLSTKPGREAYLQPIVGRNDYSFEVKVGKPQLGNIIETGTKTARGANFRCLMSGAPIAGDHIKAEGKAGRMSSRLLATVVESAEGRLYLAATPEMEKAAQQVHSLWKPDTAIGIDPRALWTPAYGLTTYGDLFTNRQLVSLTTLADLVEEAVNRVRLDASAADATPSCTPVADSSLDVEAYATAVAVYLAFAVSKAVDRNTSLCFWERPMDRLRGTFGRQGLPMVWDYAETNPFAGAGGDFYGTAHSLCEVLDMLSSTKQGRSAQLDARSQSLSENKVVSTDPPYFDNIGYADLSDFFYLWLRRSLRALFPELFSTVAVPKAEELVASPYRHGNKKKAEAFFMEGMTRSMHQLAQQSHSAFPLTIYYAFKQSESDINDGARSTGWETFLEAVISAGLALTGTWPMRTEQLAGLKGKINALASSIVLVCRPLAASASAITRREFLVNLKLELPRAVAHLQHSNIAPVDLAQAAIGPGMAVFSRHAKVLDAEGKPVGVRDALALINETLDEVLAAQEGDFDTDTRWALAWFEAFGFSEGEYHRAETLSKAKNTSISGMMHAGILVSKASKVRLLRPSELPGIGDPDDDVGLTSWELVHHLVRVLEAGGETAAAELLSRLGGRAQVARELAYRLYTICERKKRAQEALSYNALVQSWPEISRLARQGAPETQGAMFA